MLIVEPHVFESRLFHGRVLVLRLAIESATRKPGEPGRIEGLPRRKVLADHRRPRRYVLESARIELVRGSHKVYRIDDLERRGQDAQRIACTNQTTRGKWRSAQSRRHFRSECRSSCALTIGISWATGPSLRSTVRATLDGIRKSGC